MAELADAQDLKSWVPRGACGFDSRPRHYLSPDCFVAKIDPRTVSCQLDGPSIHRDRALPTLPESERKTQREIGIGAQILSDLNLRRIRLLTNHPRRVAALEGFDIEIVEQVPVPLERVKAGL